MQNEQTELALNRENDETKLTPINDVEWCYQFFENEPVVFGFGQEPGKATPLVIQLRPVEEDVLAFNHNGMIFTDKYDKFYLDEYKKLSFVLSLK
jgi:hypothetical protein